MAPGSSVLIITPAYTDTHPLLDAAVAATGLPWLVLREHSDLPRVRSALLTLAVNRRAERIILLDADTVPEPGVIARLAHDPRVTPVSAVWGLYPHRSGQRWTVEPKDAQEAERAIAEDRPFGIRQGGLGIASVHRDSLVSVLAYLPTIREPDFDWWPFCVPFTEPSSQGRARYYADDGSLCRRLANVGVELLCDPTLRATHHVGGQALRALQDETPGTAASRTPARAPRHR